MGYAVLVRYVKRRMHAHPRRVAPALKVNTRRAIPMIHLGTITNDTPDQVVAKAIRFFGPEGVGLAVAHQQGGTVFLMGGGGHVQVTAFTKEGSVDNGPTEVDIQSREWDRQAKEFLSQL